MSSAEPYNATITHWRNCSPTTAIFRVRPDTPPAPPFEPGQYATLGLPREHPPIDDPHAYPPGDPRWKRLWRRDYSIASPADERDCLEFFAVRVPAGRLTEKLWHAGEGGRLWLDPHIRGDFTLDGTAADRIVVMVATGTGVAPFVSMWRTRRGPRRWRAAVLIHSARHAAELGYESELRELAEADPGLIYLPTCTREPADGPWRGPRVRIQELLTPDRFIRHTGMELTPRTCEVFLCGNPSMIRQVGSDLRQRGFVAAAGRSGNLHVESYWEG